MSAAERWPTVLAIGPTGAGKTSLLQALFGRAVVPDHRIGHGAPTTQGFDVYEAGGLRILDSEGLDPGELGAFHARIAEAIEAAGAHPDPLRHIHVAWYCLPGPGARVTAAELAIIREVLPHVLVLVTKSDITRPGQLRDLTAVLRAAGVPAEDVLACSIGDPALVGRVVDRTVALFDASHRAVLEAARERRRGWLGALRGLVRW